MKYLSRKLFRLSCHIKVKMDELTDGQIDGQSDYYRASASSGPNLNTAH